MGKLKYFGIFFRDDKTEYHPGDVISGFCIVEVNSNLGIKCLSITLKGVAKVYWMECQERRFLEANNVLYDAEEGYVSERIDILGSISNERDVVLLIKGRHRFDFSFNLPQDGIATSFEGRYGNIKYSLTAEIHRHWNINNKLVKGFTVIHLVDINKPEYLVPSCDNMEQTIFCSFWKSGPICIDAKTDRCGYFPGECVKISANFENHSSSAIVPFAHLYQLQTYSAEGKSRMKDIKCATFTGLKLAPHTIASWNYQSLKIPASTLPTIQNSRVIRVEYFIKISIHIRGAPNVSICLPVVIGTDPSLGISSNTNNYIDIPYLPALPPYRENLTLPPPYDDPPSYEESISVVNVCGDTALNRFELTQISPNLLTNQSACTTYV